MEIKSLGEGVYHVLIEAVHVPLNDKFQVIESYAKNQLIYSKGYLGINRSNHFVLIQIHLYTGCTTEQKKCCTEHCVKSLKRILA